MPTKRWRALFELAEKMVAAPFISRAQRGGDRRALIQLWRHDARCVWCGCFTTIPRAPTPIGWHQEPQQATLDHLYQRNDLRARLRVWPKNAVVLSCYQCNTGRSGFDDLIMKGEM